VTACRTVTRVRVAARAVGAGDLGAPVPLDDYERLLFRTARQFAGTEERRCSLPHGHAGDHDITRTETAGE
jgi:hypothetical protein